MTDKRRIKDLEKRVDELEARPPAWVPMPYPVYPAPCPLPHYPRPVYPATPWYPAPVWISTTGTIANDSFTVVTNGIDSAVTDCIPFNGVNTGVAGTP